MIFTNEEIYDNIGANDVVYYWSFDSKKIYGLVKCIEPFNRYKHYSPSCAKRAVKDKNFLVAVLYDGYFEKHVFKIYNPPYRSILPLERLIKVYAP